MISSRSVSRGFTLIEVLVALAIVAVAMGAALRALSGVTEATLAVEHRLLAQWAAENRLVEIRLQRLWSAPGTHGFMCSQGGQSFYCEETVLSTVNPDYRRVEVAVFATPEKGLRLALLVGAMVNFSSNAI